MQGEPQAGLEQKQRGAEVTGLRQGPPHGVFITVSPLSLHFSASAYSFRGHDTCCCPRSWLGCFPSKPLLHLPRFPFRIGPTSSLSHLSDQPRQDVERNFTFCGFGFEVSVPMPLAHQLALAPGAGWAISRHSGEML